jgi:UDP-glucuronate decarboxylase
MNTKRILITGGAGFIGSHLCKRLLQMDNHVICMDNLFTGDIRNVTDLIENSKLEFIKHDITLPFNIKADQIYNLACPASPIHYQYEPIETMKACTLGTLNVLSLAKKYKARILQASTSEIYGDPTVHPQVETYNGNVNPIGPRSCYDEGKRATETLFFDFHRIYDLEIRVARIFNTYGPNMLPNDGRVVSNFIIQAINNKDITIYGNGLQTRSFCFITDMIEGLISLMNYNKTAFTGPINLGNPYEISIKDLAELIIKLTDAKSSIIYKELPIDDPCKRNPCIKLAQNTLGWQPNVSLIEGLKETIRYYQEKSHSI